MTMQDHYRTNAFVAIMSIHQLVCCDIDPTMVAPQYIVRGILEPCMEKVVFKSNSS